MAAEILRFRPPPPQNGQPLSWASCVADAIAVAADSTPALILGARGTGKTTLARIIHDQSPRRDAPYTSVNCAALAPELFASEMFGHESGAFTGSGKGGRRGLVEQAGDGTLFLDEIAELSPQAQAALLGFVETGIYRRVGATRTQRSAARVIAATHSPHQIRDDLFDRLAVDVVPVPDLCVRPEAERLALALHLAGGCVLDADAERLVAAYHWPGNVRELEHALRYAQRLTRRLERGLPGAAITAGALKEGIVRAQRIEAALTEGGRATWAEVDGAQLLGRGVAGVDPRLAAAAAAAAGRGEWWTRADLRVDGVGGRQLTRLLAAAVAEGVLERRGERGGTRYRWVGAVIVP